MNPFGLTDSLAIVTDPPADLVALESRANLYLAPGGRCLHGVAYQGFRQVAKRVWVCPRLRLYRVQIALEADPARLAFLAKACQARSKDLRRAAGAGPKRWRSGDEHQVT